MTGPSSPLSLEGQVAVVTGGSKGIGRRIALTFADAGADVAIAARGADDLDRTAKQIEAAGRRALAVPTDVSDAAQIQRLIDTAVEAFGTIDILVNNAGAAPFLSTIDAIRPEGFEKYFRIDFMSAFYATRAVAPVLLAKRSGCVLNVASVAAFIANPGLSYYGAAKAAMVNLTRTVALEWAPSGVRVNALAPGWVETDLNAGGRANPEWNRHVLASIPLGRWGRPEDVAHAALFLCSSGASWITGTVLVVDGGQTVSNPLGG
jgi:NAD(P)-dependent dehydrogenase (short-subunit alcohol dehydrogenase family)